MYITYTENRKQTSIEYNIPTLLSTIFSRHGIGPDMPCGGKRRCLKCKVIVRGEVSPMMPGEAALLTAREITDGVRYACMTEARGDVEVRLPRARGDQRIQTAGWMGEFKRQPWAEGLGLAFDIGTTTVAAYLYALPECRELDRAALPNPQARFGADVISRIQLSMAGESQALAEAVCGCLNELAERLCRDAGAKAADVRAVVIAGNTVMQYLLGGYDPKTLAAAPFEADRLYGDWTDGAALGLIPAGARVYRIRSLAAFVGGDITAGILSSGLLRESEAALLVDIGTNGEMALHVPGAAPGLYVCATAAGPAFEGAGIYMGMPAAAGAVSRVTVEGAVLSWETIAGAEPVGICGSGIIDAAEAFVRLGLVDETGRIDEESELREYLDEHEDAPAICLPGTSVLVTQKDIRAIQLAKAAIGAGMETLIKVAGIQPGDVKKVFLAGGFGTVLNPRSAEGIGLLLPGFAEKTLAVGNAAGAGAAMLLQSEPLIAETERLARDARVVSLADNAYFMERFVENMLFPEV